MPRFNIQSAVAIGRLGFAVWMGLATWPATAAENTAVAKHPNILLAIADDWGYGHASAYGCAWVKTPGFDRVAREGLLFTRAYTPNAKCAPSRACLLTGRNSWQLEAACNHICFFPEKFKTYAEALADHGYFVGKTTKGWGPGIANDAEGKPRAMAGRAFDQRKAPPPAQGISNSDYAGNFANFLRDCKKITCSILRWQYGVVPFAVKLVRFQLNTF